jgi:hypothetical protein
MEKSKNDVILPVSDEKKQKKNPTFLHAQLVVGTNQ